jgi:tetratricopeptide (TPR) repeat protein
MESSSRINRRQVKRSAPAANPSGLGERLRQIRLRLGMTQSDLAGDRFSKEYVSQIERGKTRPTNETIRWLAARLGVDAGFLVDGISTDQRDRIEAGLARAEALSASDLLDEALSAYEDLKSVALAVGVPPLEVRTLVGHGRVLQALGRINEALDLLARARELTEASAFSDIERAEVLYRLGVCRYKLSSIATAVSLLNEALMLAERSEMPSDQLRSEILHWRSRCYRRQRDYEAAREDVEQALELAERLGDRRAMGRLYFQASLLAERAGHWVLARSYAERSKAQAEFLSDRKHIGRVLNNLGGLTFLLGDPEKATRYLKDAFAAALDVGSDVDAAQAVSSLAQVHLRTGQNELAEQQARQALGLLDGRVDFLDEIGSAQLVLGRALLEQDRLDEAQTAFEEADSSFAQLSSASHRATGWIAQGDLAMRRGDDRTAAHLYRRAAEALQDVRF